VAELVDALDLGSSIFDVKVRVFSSALNQNIQIKDFRLCEKVEIFFYKDFSLQKRFST
jgi:hypothetical protein